jgi:DNA-binding transcriptional LysR family regulator
MSERFNLEYLNTFMIAAETGKFNTTAELVYLSHSSVSTQIKKLEDQVGTLLFIRNKDTLTLTQTGETLYNYAKKILELNDKAFNSMSNSNWEGAVTFGLPTDYSQLYLQRIYPLLKKRYPNFSFSTVCSRSRAIRKQIEEAKINVAIIAMEPQYLEDIPLWEEKLFWVANQAFDVESNRPLPIALFSDNCIVNNHSLHCLKKTNIDFEVVFTSSMLENIADCVKSGLAVSLLPESLINEEFKILSEDFISCPYKLKLGLTWDKNAHMEMVEEIALLVQSSLSGEEKI